MFAAVNFFLAGNARLRSTITLSADTLNYTLDTSKVSGYVAGITDVTLIINSGVYLGSASTGSPALRIDTTWSAFDTVTIINNGYVVGCGGGGGIGGEYSATAGGGAGLAVDAQRVVTFINNGTVGGGGGGGGGGGYGYYTYSYITGYSKFGPTYATATAYYGGGGGGGGQGFNGGAGGRGGNLNGSGSAGSAGDKTTAGSGGAGGGGSSVAAGNGGGGGTFGSTGGTGGAGNGGAAGGGSGAGCLVGLSYVNAGAGISGTTFGGQS